MSTSETWAPPPPSYTDSTGIRTNNHETEYPIDTKDDTSEAEVTTKIPQVSGYSTYTIEFAKNSYHMDYLIKDADDTPVYYVNNKLVPAKLRGGRPDVTVHQGKDDSGPIVFASRSSFWGVKHGIIHGDPATSDEQEELSLKNVVSLTTTWSPPGSERKYTFQRIYGKEAEALGSRNSSFLSLKLTDDETGEIMATYLNDGAKTWRKAGTYQIKPNPEIGEEWDKFVLCVACVLTEKERRARRWGSI
ncbi:hypothetical protein ABW20_dc0110573 [Dactylellina cionopaga]|nr:hypothetical protein ABW20_dc0110573 [Dactylellina cionopaga]